MGSFKNDEQRFVGTPEKRRGQQTGFAGNADQNREEMEQTPARRGKAKRDNKMFGDVSEQHVGSDAVTPSSNSPSTPAMKMKPSGRAGGAAQFKKRLAKQRSS